MECFWHRSAAVSTKSILIRRLVDITEDDREYRIKAELPEVRKEDVKVAAEFKDGVLAVRLTKNEKARPKSVEVKVG